MLRGLLSLKLELIDFHEQELVGTGSFVSTDFLFLLLNYLCWWSSLDPEGAFFWLALIFSLLIFSGGSQVLVL